jgi:hypothetical protein
MENIQDKIAAQKEYQKKTNSPSFAPSNGVCFKCRRQIYTEISLERASTTLITGCPHCHYSFCE